MLDNPYVKNYNKKINRKAKMQKQKRITLNAEKRKVLMYFKIILKIIQNLRKHGNKQKTLTTLYEKRQKFVWKF